MLIDLDSLEEFSKRFASWVRIEPRARQDDFSQGLEARVADPLWMLARQWQMGEFAGEDNGSPVKVQVEYENYPVANITLGSSGTAIPLENAPPMEILVEQEPVGMDWRMRIRIGQQFERYLKRELGDQAEEAICSYRNAYPIVYPPESEERGYDYATRRFLKLMAGRAINGETLLTAINNNAVSGLPGENARKDLPKWYKNLYAQPDLSANPAWQQERLEYKFSAQASYENGGTVMLTAPEYRNGELDWYTFSLAIYHSITLCQCIKQFPLSVFKKISKKSDSTWETFSPTRVGFAGKPNERWWAFEDNDIDFGNLNVATTDIAKLMLMEFALVHADDWYQIPLDVPTGSLTKIVTLKVTNVFGEEIQFSPARYADGDPLNQWEIFTLSKQDQPSGSVGSEFLFIPQALPGRDESEPLEEVRFIRDEGANMVFAIEHSVQNMLGYPVAGFEAQREKRERASTGGPNNESSGIVPLAVPVYRLQSTVPNNWIPFVPIRSGAASMRLRQAEMMRNETANAPEGINAMTRILGRDGDAKKLIWLNEESVPRAGTKAQLTMQRARGIDGKTYVWLGRKVKTGKGEGSSGLKFDFLKK